jgi:structural maintenance of chromosome 1
MLMARIEFERKQLENTRERLASLKSTIKCEKKNIASRQEQKAELEQEVQDLTKSLEKLRKKLQDAQAIQDEASDNVERARDSARKMQRELDKVLKQIAGWNDEIEKSSSDRHAIYRRCRLEEIDIPLVSGSLDKVPLVEVRSSFTPDGKKVELIGRPKTTTRWMLMMMGLSERLWLITLVWNLISRNWTRRPRR